MGAIDADNDQLVRFRRLCVILKREQESKISIAGILK